MVTGRDLVTGEQLSATERGLGVFGVRGDLLGLAARHGDEVAMMFGWGRHLDEWGDAVRRGEVPSRPRAPAGGDGGRGDGDTGPGHGGDPNGRDLRDFDADGRAWDVKSSNSNYRNGFNLGDIEADFETNLMTPNPEKYMVDTTNMSAQDVGRLRDLFAGRDWSDYLVLYP